MIITAYAVSMAQIQIKREDKVERSLRRENDISQKKWKLRQNAIGKRYKIRIIRFKYAKRDSQMLNENLYWGRLSITSVF